MDGTLLKRSFKIRTSDGKEAEIEAEGTGDCYLSRCPFCPESGSVDLDIRIGARIFRCDMCKAEGSVVDAGIAEPVKIIRADPLVKVYSGWAGDFSRVYAEHTEAPRSFYFIGALTCLGVLMTGRVTLASVVHPQPRLFTLILGESADDRKSTAIRLVVKFFQDTFIEREDIFNVAYGVGSAEGLAELFKGAKKKLLLVFDEFRAFVAKAKIEGSILLTTVNTLFELNKYQNMTKKHAINLDGVHLSILGASTVDTYGSMFDHTFLDIGFLNRFFVIKDHGERKFAIPPKIDRSADKKLREDLGAIWKVATDISISGPHEVMIDEEAFRRFNDWYFSLPQGHSAKRLDAYGMRLMPLLMMNDGLTSIDTSLIDRVITLLNHELEVRQEVDPIDADSKIAVMEEKIRRVLNKEERSERDLKRMVNAHRAGLFVFNSALNNLIKSREIRREWGVGVVSYKISL